MSKSYGVYNDERGTADRSVMLVDKQGVVRFKRLYSTMSQFDIKDILAEVDKL